MVPTYFNVLICFWNIFTLQTNSCLLLTSTHRYKELPITCSNSWYLSAIKALSTPSLSQFCPFITVSCWEALPPPSPFALGERISQLLAILIFLITVSTIGEVTAISRDVTVITVSLPVGFSKSCSLDTEVSCTFDIVTSHSRKLWYITSLCDV